MGIPQASFKDAAYLKAVYRYNRFRFARLRRRLKGRVKFSEGCDIWVPGFRYKGAGTITFGRGAILERTEFPSIFDTEAGSRMVFGDRAYIRSKYCSNVLTCFKDASIEVGEDSLLNGAIITSKNLVRLGRKVLVSWHVTIMDSDMHDMSNTNAERIKTVEIDDYVWVGTGAIIMPGVKIGSHSIIAASSVVNRDVPSHTLVAGVPAEIIREVDDRDTAK